MGNAIEFETGSDISTARAAFTARQKSEIAYHAGYAALNRPLADTPVELEVCTSQERRRWNAYWSLYDILRNSRLDECRVLVPGSGFGEDCIRLAHLGAEVVGIDISPEIVEIARNRANRFAPGTVSLEVMPCERMDFPDASFDAVVLVNILHHVDVVKTMREVRRVSKPGAHIVGLEMYTHSLSQRVRNSAFMANIVYPRVVRRIYGDKKPYITPDERKIDEKELAYITRGLHGCTYGYFSIFAERFFSGENRSLCKLDRRLARGMGPLAGLCAGRVIFSGVLEA
ncbi:MAG: class I SAM-dependent methyltransferase [Rhodospirillaceae bacterium]